MALKWGCQRGAGLIEVLVAVVVLGVGLLGAAGMQLAGLQGGHSAYQRSQATWLANDLIDRLRARRPEACSAYADDSDDADRVNWNATVAALLGAGANGSLASCSTDSDVEVRISWSDQRGNIKGAGGDATAGDQSGQQTFVFWTRI